MTVISKESIFQIHNSKVLIVFKRLIKFDCNGFSFINVPNYCWLGYFESFAFE